MIRILHVYYNCRFFLRYAILPINSIVEFAVLVDGQCRGQRNFQNSGILNVRFGMFAPFW